MAGPLWNVKASYIAILLPMSSSSSDRPRLTRKGEATRARIVGAAAGLSCQQGVAPTTAEGGRAPRMAGLLRWPDAGRPLPDPKPPPLALALLAALAGGLLLAQIQRDPEPLAAALDAMLTLIATLSSPTSTSLDR